MADPYRFLRSGVTEQFCVCAVRPRLVRLTDVEREAGWSLRWGRRPEVVVAAGGWAAANCIGASDATGLPHVRSALCLTPG